MLASSLCWQSHRLSPVTFQQDGPDELTRCRLCDKTSPSILCTEKCALCKLAVTMNYIRSMLNSVLPDSSLVQLRALDHRFHSPAEVRLLASLCDRRKVSIDVGANLGVLTYFLARYSSHVVAYEPNPELASMLRRSFKRKVTVRQTAISDASGSTTLKVPEYHGVEMHGLASIAQDFS